MAKFRGSKEGLTRDPSMSMPAEQKTSESNKQKIGKIYDMFPDLTKDNIAKILQFYEDDESKAVDAITRDGGCEALSNWAESGSLKSKNSKNKKKKKKAKRDAASGIANTASFDADDSSSLHSGGNVDADVEKDSQRTENGNGILTDIVDETENLDNILSNHTRLNNNEIELAAEEPEKEAVTFTPELKYPQEDYSSTGPEGYDPLLSTNCDKSDAEHPTYISPSLDTSEKQNEQIMKRENKYDKYRPINENYSKHPPRQRTSSFRRNKTSSISEDPPSQHNPQAMAAPTKRGYEKCKKDLNRQTASLQRIHSQLEKGFEDSEKRVKNVFTELQKLLENRLKEVESELQKTKIEAFNLLKSRQDLGSELKKRVDRTASLTESEWSELRSDIKQFVTERKYDDDLGKTIWFHWTDISENIKSLGEVNPVKNVYSQRSHSALGNSAVSNNNPEPSPSSSLANEEIGSTADKNDVGNISDAVEDEAPPAGKEETLPFNKTQPKETRTTRVYSNRSYERYPHGRVPGRGFFRGHRGFQHNFKPNYTYNKHNNYNNYDEHRNHPHQSYTDRDGRVNEGHYLGDRNMNITPRDYKNNRNQGRGHHMNFKYNNNRFRGNTGGPRQHVGNHPEIDPSANGANVNTEKSNVINGFVNN